MTSPTDCGMLEGAYSGFNLPEIVLDGTRQFALGICAGLCGMYPAFEKIYVSQSRACSRRCRGTSCTKSGSLRSSKSFAQFSLHVRISHESGDSCKKHSLPYGPAYWALGLLLHGSGGLWVAAEAFGELLLMCRLWSCQGKFLTCPKTGDNSGVAL